MTMAEGGLCTGPQHALQILILQPLFEEANRTRRMIATLMRRLDELGVGATLPDLPGTGESLIAIEDVQLSDWASAVEAMAARHRACMIAALRGGAIIPCHTLPRWHFSPESGARIARDLKRTQFAGESGLYSGHRLTDSFLADLEAQPIAASPQLRTVRLESDSAQADARVVGAPLWRRAEPGEDEGLSHTLAQDLADWVKPCAAA